MLDAVESRLKRLLTSVGGRTLLEGLEREASETERALDVRHAAAARIEEARKRDREERPRLETAVKKADAVLAEARRRFEEAKKAQYEAAMAHSRHRDRVREDVRGGEAELRRTADPRLLVALDRLYTACANFPHLARRLLQLELRGEFMEAHYAALNKAEVDSLEARLDTALETVQRWVLVPDPDEEELRRVLAEADAAVGAASLPESGGR